MPGQLYFYLISKRNNGERQRCTSNNAVSCSLCSLSNGCEIYSLPGAQKLLIITPNYNLFSNCNCFTETSSYSSHRRQPRTVPPVCQTIIIARDHCVLSVDGSQKCLTPSLEPATFITLIANREYSKQSHRGDRQRPSDGTFNGIPILETQSFLHLKRTLYGCQQPKTAWKQQSCYFTNPCFNTTSKELAVFASPAEYKFATKYLSERPHLHTSN